MSLTLKPPPGRPGARNRGCIALGHISMASDDASLIERGAMFDVQVTACVRAPDGDGGRRQEVREFRTTTAG